MNENNVELIGTYGGDITHAQSAWTSTYRDLSDDKLARMDKMLIRLAQAGHETPFEKSAIHFLVTADTASHIHLIKHRIGVSINVESARYKELKDDKFYVPTDWNGVEVFDLLEHLERSYELYHKYVARLEPKLGRKRAKESARYFLPYAQQVTMDVQFNFRSFIHFLRLRLDEHAQKEIREIAQQMLDLVRETGDFKYSLVGFGY